MVSGFVVDFTWLLQVIIHERAFKGTTTYPFPCMSYELCTFSRVPVWHIDVLRTPTGIVYIGLIRDEANELAPNIGSRVEVQPFVEKLADTVEKA